MMAGVTRSVKVLRAYFGTNYEVVRSYELEAGACQARDNGFCNLKRFLGIHPFVWMMSAGFAYHRSDY